jgi:two-component system OmpR family sensor kinase
MVEDLLLLARLDEGRPLERERVDLAAIVTEAVETARTVDPGRSVELAVEPAEVIGDRDRLRQIVDNLLGNVRAHTPAGTPAAVRVTSAEGRAHVTVTDSGPGLPASDAERVFERFFRADPSRARSSGGVGLGLSIVAAVASAHGGEALVRSGPDGSTFEIVLPLAGPAA